jgi:hypothetical protein
MTVVTLHRLVDGPICLDVARQERIEKVAAGAAAVLKNGSYADVADTLRTLRQQLGWSTYEAMLLVDDIRQVAVQHAVAMEMGEP